MIKLNSLVEHPDIYRGQLLSQEKDSRISINQFRHGISFFQNSTRLFNTRKALLLFEKECLPVLYVPKTDIFERHFLPSANSSYCPFKGDANYWSLSINDEIIVDAVWEYAAPKLNVAAIDGHVAFSNHQSKGLFHIYEI
ncbi:hypothetical protein MNBD_GAMMA05-2004 [hydrothermal vent metagenome]|uniref:DUF427 domain-containing protein n=1 Tax=hydrothermal vent metagenome TaxID=652676 RepID=A0A3B0W7Q6_9ZZZZ